MENGRGTTLQEREEPYRWRFAPAGLFAEAAFLAKVFGLSPFFRDLLPSQDYQRALSWPLSYIGRTRNI